MRTKYLFLLSCLFFTSVLFLPNATAQNYNQWSLPEGAKARLGKGTIKKVKLSPDGTLLAVASSIGVWLYDAHTGEELTLLTGHTQSVNSVAFSSDGKTLASGSADFTIRLWEVSTGTHLKTLKGHTSEVTSLCFSSDGHTLASGEAFTIRLWRVAYGTHLKTLKASSGTISIAFSDDGRTIVSVSYDKTINLWNAVSGEHIKTLNVDAERIDNIVFSGDGKTLASTGDGIHLWDTFSGEQLKTLKRDTKLVSSVAFSRDGNTLASASEDEINLWDLTSSTHLKTLIGHTDPIIGLDFSDDGKTLVSASEIEVYLWNSASGKHLETFTEHTKPFTSVAFSKDGNTLAGASGKKIYLWDAASVTKRKTLPDHIKNVIDIAFSDDGETLASASEKEIYLWDVVSGKRLELLTGYTGFIRDIAFSSDGKILAGVSGDKLHLWDTASGELLKTRIEHKDLLSVAFSSDGKILAGVSGDKLHLWDTASGKHQETSTTYRDLIFIASSNDNDWQTFFAAADSYGTIHLWDASLDEYRKRTLTTESIESIERVLINIQVALNRDDDILASTYQNRIHLWDVKSGMQRKTLMGHIGEVESTAFNDDNTLASASKDGTVLLWNGNINISRSRQPRLKKADIAKKAMNSTVAVVADVITSEEGKLKSVKRFGSGFVLVPIDGKGDSIIATNYHVVEHFYNEGEFVTDSYVKLVNRDKSYTIKKIVAVDEKNDLVILKIDGNIGSYLRLEDSNEIEFGAPVCAVGNPSGMEGTPSWGIVTGIRKENSKTLFQIDAAVSKGSSGGPLLNDRGEVIGIVVSGVEEGLDLNFAIPSNYLRKLRDKVRGQE